MVLKTGQVSTEYLIIVGFVTFLIVSVLGLSIFYSSQINDRIKMNHLQNFANKVISSSEEVFYSGEPSRATVNAYLPSGIHGIEIYPSEIVFNASVSNGNIRISFTSKVPIEGTLGSTEGVKVIVIRAESDRVIVSEAG